MERYLLAGSTFCGLLGFAYSLLLPGAGKFRAGSACYASARGGDPESAGRAVAAKLHE